MKKLAIDFAYLFFPLLASALAALLVKALAGWLKKQGLELTAAQQAKLEELARKAILAVEEWARAQAKAGITTPSDIKFAMAKNILSEQLPEVSDTILAATLNSQLATIRACTPGDLAALRLPKE